MTKTLFFCGLTLLGFSFRSQAQIQFGVKGGLNIASQTIAGAAGAGTGSIASFHGGGLVRIPFGESKFALQPELVYSGQGTKGSISSLFNLNLTNSADALNSKTHAGYLNIPILVQFKLPVGIYFDAGPQVGFLLSAKQTANGKSTSVDSNYKKTDISLAFGAGYVSPFNIGIDVRYNVGLTNVSKNDPLGSFSGITGVKNSVFQIGIFYLFGGNKD